MLTQTGAILPRYALCPATMSLPATPRTAAFSPDEPGLICGFRFSTNARPVAFDDPDEAWSNVPEQGPDFVWLHFNVALPGASSWLRTHDAVGAGFFEALTDGSRSTRIERDGDALFAVINDVTFDFSFDPGDVATLWVSVRQNVVISARRQPLRAVDRLRTAIKGGETLQSPTALLNHLVADQADELQRIVRRAADRIDDLEDQLLAGRMSVRGGELAQLRRLAVRLQRLLTPEPAVLQRLLAKPPTWVAPDDLLQLSRASEEFALVLRDIGSFQDRVKLIQDEAATRVNEENNRSLFMLTMVTVLALPINLVAGLLGMNVGGIPLADHPHGFIWTLGAIALLTVTVAWLVTRRVRAR